MSGQESAGSESWRRFLLGDPPPRSLKFQRASFRHLPSAPHCKLCEVPMAGPGGAVFGRMGFRQWSKSPQFCEICSKSLAKLGMGGAEVPLSSLFADLRDSTTMAESIGAAAFGALINRFYLVADAAIAAHGGIVERHMGDGVVGLFVPVFSGTDHAANAIAAARAIVAGTSDRGG